MVLTRKCFARIIFCCLCVEGVRLLSIGHSVTLSPSVKQNGFGARRPQSGDTHVSRRSQVTSLSVLITRPRYQAPNIYVCLWAAGEIREDLVVTCAGCEGMYVS